MSWLSRLLRTVFRAGEERAPPAVERISSQMTTPLPGAAPPPVLGARGTVGKESRSWRNRNPGNIRPPSSWRPFGVVATDERPGGPFMIFESEEAGWCALANLVLRMSEQGDRRTVEQIIHRWAPPTENNTERYITGVAAELGVPRDRPLNVRDWMTMETLAKAIARHEGLRTDPPWEPEARRRGFEAAGLLRPWGLR